MNEKESKATKYDWADVPEQVNIITTDMDGNLWLWVDDTMPSDLVCAENVWGMTNEAYWDEERSISSVRPERLNITLSPFAGDWRDSLEQRPHKCTPCPNFTNDTCCHSAAKPVHTVTMKVWGQV